MQPLCHGFAVLVFATGDGSRSLAGVCSSCVRPGTFGGTFGYAGRSGRREVIPARSGERVASQTAPAQAAPAQTVPAQTAPAQAPGGQITGTGVGIPDSQGQATGERMRPGAQEPGRYGLYAGAASQTFSSWWLPRPDAHCPSSAPPFSTTYPAPSHPSVTFQWGLDYVVGPGDTLTSSYPARSTCSTTSAWTRPASINVPALGAVHVAGVPFGQLQGFLHGSFPASIATSR